MNGGKNDYIYGNGTTTATPTFNPTDVVKPPSVFEQAGTLQSDAALEASQFEQGFLEQAIAQLMGFGGFSPYQQAGEQGLQGLQQGATAGGMDEILSEIMGGEAFGSLVDERRRGVEGQLAAGGLTRSGSGIEAAAAVPQDVALGLENLLAGRQSGLANLGLGAAGSQGNIATNIAQLLGQQGQVGAGGITGSAEALASGILGEKAYQLQRQQARDQNQAAGLSLIGTGIGGYFGGPLGASIGGGIGSMFSDPRLKKNVEVAGKIGPLDLVRWEWIDEVKDTIVDKCATIGFMSTQVREHYPECVGEFGGFDIVDYPRLIEELECH